MLTLTLVTIVQTREVCHILVFETKSSTVISEFLIIFIVILAFLSWLRLAIYMAVVSVAILISFHLKSQPSPLERRIALPFGIIFWFLALACLASGTANYIKTVKKYSKRQALVQTGWKTQLIQVFTVVATAIVAACVLFLSTNAGAKERTR
ncbi:hypothetical protein E4T48_06462 [Aureobasidium sp. EXF-10727]|nr:hypothetical protein E4T48_06462 [Aureobasidium sp. EXF-10727]